MLYVPSFMQFQWLLFVIQVIAALDFAINVTKNNWPNRIVRLKRPKYRACSFIIRRLAWIELRFKIIRPLSRLQYCNMTQDANRFQELRKCRQLLECLRGKNQRWFYMLRKESNTLLNFHLNGFDTIVIWNFVFLS